MTRAQDHLRLLLPQRFYVHQQAAHGDRHVYAAKSRFLPKATLPFFDQRAWPAADPATAGTDALPRYEGPPIDVAARIRALWR